MAKMRQIEQRHRRQPIAILPMEHVTRNGPCHGGFASIVMMMERRGMLDAQPARDLTAMSRIRVSITPDTVYNMMVCSRNVQGYVRDLLVGDNPALLTRRWERNPASQARGRNLTRGYREELSFIFCEQYRTNDKFYNAVDRQPTERAERRLA